MDPGERIEVLDAEGIDAVVLYTTIGLLWEADLDDADVSQAYTGRTTAGSASSARRARARSRRRISR
jgi:hypothetical protein